MVNCNRMFFMRPSSLGGGRILRHTLSVSLSVCLSVRPSRARMYFVYICTVLWVHIQNRKTSVFAYGPASRMYFSARADAAEGRISYGHLGRTNSCFFCCPCATSYGGIAQTCLSYDYVEYLLTVCVHKTGWSQYLSSNHSPNSFVLSAN